MLRGDTERIGIGRCTTSRTAASCTPIPAFRACWAAVSRWGTGRSCMASQYDNVMIGMRAVVMNGAVIRENSIVGVGAVVTEGTEVPAALVLGLPGQIIRPLQPGEIERIVAAASHYVLQPHRI